MSAIEASAMLDVYPSETSYSSSTGKKPSSRKRCKGVQNPDSDAVSRFVSNKMAKRSSISIPSLTEMLKDKKISVITEVIGGHGDVMGAAKIALYLHQKLGVDLNNIVLGIGLPDPPDILQNARIPLANLMDDRLRNADIVIAGPGFRLGFFPEIYARNSQTPVLMIHEYGVSKRSIGEGNIRTDSLGLSEDSLGILLTPELLEWSSSEKTDIERLQKLQFLPQHLQNEILGSEYSEASVESFSRSSKLYFGYAHTDSIQSSFLKAVASMNFQLGDPSNLYFYFMGDSVPQFSALDVELFIRLGFGSIEYASEKNPGSNKSLIISESGKKLKIITGPLDPEHVPVMHMASEYETLATGDQSFSEAVSAGKIPVYEVFFHKMPFFTQFCGLLPKALQKTALDFYAPRNIFPISYDLDVEKLAQFYLKRRTTPKTRQLIDATVNQIKSHHDFGPKFEQVLYDSLKKSEGCTPSYAT